MKNSYSEWVVTIMHNPKYLGMDLSRAAWDHQQKKIDKLTFCRHEGPSTEDCLFFNDGDICEGCRNKKILSETVAPGSELQRSRE